MNRPSDEHTGAEHHAEDPLWHLAEQYLLDELSPQDKTRFESDMASNPALRHAVEDLRQSIQAVRLAGLRTTLDEIHRDKITSKKSLGNGWMGIAAGFMVLVAGAFWWLARPDANERLFAQYSTVDPGLPVPMSSTDEYVFYDAMVDYKTRDYQRALSKWTPLLDKRPDNDTLNFYIGVARFNLEKYPSALSFLQRIPDTSRFYDRAEWYTTLIYLYEDDVERLMKVSPRPQSVFVDRISDIQAQME